VLTVDFLSQLRRPGIRLGRRADASPKLVMVIVCAGVVLASLDLFIVNIALPDIARDLHQPNLGALSWVLNGYAIVYAAALVLLGRLSEGRRRDNGFLLGVLVFTLASAACGAASDLAMLVAFRIVQALGAALLTPTSLSLVLATTPADRRHGAVRTWTAIGGLAAALGPVVGGLLVAINWRWVFYVNVPIGLLALVLGWRRLPRVSGHPVPRPDGLGAVLVTTGTAALTLGLVEGNDWGWESLRTITALAGAVVSLAWFAWRCGHHRAPLIDAALLRVRAFRGSALVAAVFTTAFGAMLFSRVLWCQDVWGWSALRTGLALAPGPLMVPLFSFLVTGRLIKRLGPGATIGIGATVFAAGATWWALAAGLGPDYVGEMLGGTLLTGAGVGITLPTFMATGAAALPAHSFATGSAVLNMLRQVGLAVGIAVFIAVLGTPHGPNAVLSGYRVEWLVIAATSLASAFVGLVALAGRLAATTVRPETDPVRVAAAVADTRP
jgi:EmrB/QacA subfamily drug resistance transporter